MIKVELVYSTTANLKFFLIFSEMEWKIHTISTHFLRIDSRAYNFHILHFVLIIHIFLYIIQTSQITFLKQTKNGYKKFATFKFVIMLPSRFGSLTFKRKKSEEFKITSFKRISVRIKTTFNQKSKIEFLRAYETKTVSCGWFDSNFVFAFVSLYAQPWSSLLVLRVVVLLNKIICSAFARNQLNNLLCISYYLVLMYAAHNVFYIQCKLRTTNHRHAIFM